MFPRYVMHEIHTDEFPVRSVLIEGEHLQLLWDTLTHPRDLKPLRLAPEKPCLVVYSHADWDHIQGTAAVNNALVIGQRECARRFEHEAPRTLRTLQAGAPGMWDDVRLIAPAITFDKRLDIDLGGCVAHLRHLPGHTPDSITAFIPRLRLLLAGDAAELPCPCVPPDCDLKAWIQGLKHWADHDGVRHVIPSHGAPGGREILMRTMDYLNTLRAGILPPPPRDAGKFYARTHSDNLRHCGLDAGGL